MAGLIGNLLGSRNVDRQTGSQNQTTKRVQNPREQQLQDILVRILTSQLVSPPNSAISVPFQQAVSSAQANMGRLNNQAAHGLASIPPPDSAISSGASFLPPSLQAAASPAGGPPGAPAPAVQAGLQTRQELGLPDRSSYLGPLAPTTQDVKNVGVAPIRGGSAALQRVNTRLAKVSDRLKAADTGGNKGLIDRLTARQAKLTDRKKALSA